MFIINNLLILINFVIITTRIKFNLATLTIYNTDNILFLIRYPK